MARTEERHGACYRSPLDGVTGDAREPSGDPTQTSTLFPARAGGGGGERSDPPRRLRRDGSSRGSHDGSRDQAVPHYSGRPPSSCGHSSRRGGHGSCETCGHDSPSCWGHHSRGGYEASRCCIASCNGSDYAAHLHTHRDAHWHAHSGRHTADRHWYGAYQHGDDSCFQHSNGDEYHHQYGDHHRHRSGSSLSLTPDQCAGSISPAPVPAGLKVVVVADRAYDVPAFVDRCGA